jgi:uncharacterized membrane protein YeiH
MTVPIGDILLLLDLTGTFVFALSGALVGVRRRMDLFGVLVLSFAASSSGGIIRDLLIGATPPAAIADWRYAVTSFAAGVIVFVFPRLVERGRHPVLLLDAGGLALFAVAGAETAVAAGLNPLAAVLLGTLTGVGGGVVRDILAAQVPAVLRTEIYAVAAALGATVVVAAPQLGIPAEWRLLSGAALCFVLRMIAILTGWQLPRAIGSGDLDDAAR